MYRPPKVACDHSHQASLHQTPLQGSGWNHPLHVSQNSIRNTSETHSQCPFMLSPMQISCAKSVLLTYTYHLTLSKAELPHQICISLPPGSDGSPPILPLDDDYTTHAHADNISLFAHRVCAIVRSQLFVRYFSTCFSFI
jgi:hypothetical protein